MDIKGWLLQNDCEIFLQLANEKRWRRSKSGSLFICLYAKCIGHEEEEQTRRAQGQQAVDGHSDDQLLLNYLERGKNDNFSIFVFWC